MFPSLPARCSRPAFAALAIAWSVAAAPALRADNESLTFEPPLPTTDDVVVAVVHQTGSCRVWIDVDRSGGVLAVLAREGLSPCPPDVAAALATQRLSLGRLSLGVHLVEARMQPPSNAVLATGGTEVLPAAGGSDPSFDLDPRLPTSEDAIELRVRGTLYCVTGLESASVDGFLVNVVPMFLPIDPCPPLPPVDRTFALGELPPGEYRVALADAPIGGFHVAAPSSILTLRFDGVDAPVRELSAALDRSYPPLGLPRLARAVALGDQAGYFWFFEPGNVEVTLKLLDGRPINGHLWVFASSLTDRPFTLTVIDQSRCDSGDPPSCPTRTYTRGPGVVRSIVDLAAFPD